MKRSIVMLGAVTLLAGIPACRAPDGPAASAASDEQGWITPPRVETAVRDKDSLVLTGRTDPDGRVVLRAAGGVAYAVGADDAGRFEVRIAVPTTDTLFDVESQQGQIATPAPARLLIAADPKGPIALLAAGAPTRRLDQAGPLDVIDMDGEALLASGRTTPSASVTVDTEGRRFTTVADARGRWALNLPPQVASLTVGGRLYENLANVTQTMEAPKLERSGRGWLLSWQSNDGASQTSWFPQDT